MFERMAIDDARQEGRRFRAGAGYVRLGISERSGEGRVARRRGAARRGRHQAPGTRHQAASDIALLGRDGLLGDARLTVGMTSAVLGVRRRAAAPDVTVVIPTRDRWDLLRTTLRSVLEQRDVDLEVVIVDDGSSRSPSSVPDLDDPGVRVVRHDRSRGVAAARNAGIAKAAGTWIAFLDDDDVWAPDKLNAQLGAAEAADAAFAYTGVLLVRDDNGAVALAEPPPPDELAELLQSYDAIPAGASNVLVRTELIRSVGGFDLDFRHLADWDLWIRLAAAGAGAACPRPLVSLSTPCAQHALHGGGSLPRVAGPGCQVSRRPALARRADLGLSMACRGPASGRPATGSRSDLRSRSGSLRVPVRPATGVSRRAHG